MGDEACVQADGEADEENPLSEEARSVILNKEIKNMKLLDKIEKFDTEAKKAEENYKAMGADREQHQKKMLEFIHKKLEEAPKRK